MLFSDHFKAVLKQHWGLKSNNKDAPFQRIYVVLKSDGLLNHISVKLKTSLLINWLTTLVITVIIIIQLSSCANHECADLIVN